MVDAVLHHFIHRIRLQTPTMYNSHSVPPTSSLPHPLAVAVGMLLCSAWLGYGVTQSDFVGIALGFAAFFGLYFWLLLRAASIHLYAWLGVAVMLRLVLLGAFPQLSDDIYRFVWDGRLWNAGINPYDHLPVWYLQPEHAVPGLDAALFARLNSPAYHTIYPPVAQAVFALACWVSPDSLLGASIVIKVFLLACEVGSMVLLVALLRHFRLPEHHALWYALNPLIILEVVGNLHFEGAMICFLLLGWYFLIRGTTLFSAVFVALSVASKLLPLMFLPFLIRRLGWRRSIGYFALLGACLVLLWLPLFNASFFTHFGSSLQLYFKRFEFNGSVYYALREFGYMVWGRNILKTIGPWLGLTVLVGITWYALRERRSDWGSLPGAWLFSISLYLLLASTVHPWYAALPLVLCIFTPYRWPVLWTALIPLTYITYRDPGFHENPWLIALEYGLVIAFGIWEWGAYHGRIRVQPGEPLSESESPDD